MRAVRSAVGDSVDILVDLMHQFRDAKQVLDIFRQLDSCNLFWVEDPFVHDHLVSWLHSGEASDRASQAAHRSSRDMNGAPCLRAAHST